MDAVKNLPTPVKIAAPIILVLIIGMLLRMMVFAEPPAIEVVKSQDYNLIETSKRILTNKGITPEEVVEDGNMVSLTVPAGSTAEDAAQALAASGIKDRTGLAKKIACPAAPGFTATKAANERADNCADAEKVQGMLLTAGALAANVSVSQEENGTLIGPEKSKNVVAQVFLPKTMEGSWPADNAARAIAGSVGTSTDRVTITDDQLLSLFDGAKSGGAASAEATGDSVAGGALGLGCNDIATANEVETKKAAVRSCYTQTISRSLTKLLGGSERFVLTVEPTIDSIARTTTRVRNSRGPIVDRSAQKGSGNSSIDESSDPNSSEETSINPAGDISSLRISATLDKAVVTADQVVAVRNALRTYIDTKRGDPLPIVTLTTFTNGAGEIADGSAIEEIRAQAGAASMEPEPQAPQSMERPPTPMWLYALGGILVASLATSIFLLWRRSKQIAAERRAIEDSFRNDQRLFENFAQQNPDDIARELNALFGAPPATGQRS